MKRITNLIKAYKDYRLRKFCVKQVCRSGISQSYGIDVDGDSGKPISLPLGNEAQKMYQFIKDGSIPERLR